jgi:hypothetical protein
MSRSNSLADANSKLRREIHTLQTALKGLDFSHSPIGNRKIQRQFVGKQRETISKHLLNRLEQPSPRVAKADMRLDLGGFTAMRKPKLKVLVGRAAPILSDTISTLSKSTRALDDSIKSFENSFERTRKVKGRRVSFEVEPNPFEISSVCLAEKENIASPSLHDRTLQDSFESYYESEEENLSHKGKCQLSFAEYKQDHQKGTRRKEKELLLQEIENLRAENLKLKSCLMKPKPNKTKGKTPKSRNAREKSPFGKVETSRLK